MGDTFAVIAVSRESDACRLITVHQFREAVDEIALAVARRVRNEDVLICRAIAKVEVLNADEAWRTGKRAPLEVRDMEASQ